MDFKLLEDFTCLVRMESFTSAASERNITQSALSRRIQSLEKWLGTALINRSAKPFTLTPQGRVFASEAEVLLQRLINARDTTLALGGNQSFEIVVASQNSIAQTLFLDWAKRLEGQLDNIFIRLLSEKLSECITLLNKGHASYLFCYANTSFAVPIDESQFTYLTVGKENLIPVSAPKSGQSPLFELPGSLDQRVPFIAYSANSIFGKAVDQLTQNKSHQCFLSRHFENPYSHTLKSLVLEQLGFAWLPETSIRADLENGSLCRAGNQHWDIEFDIRLYFRDSATSSQESTILEITREMAGELVWAPE